MGCLKTLTMGVGISGDTPLFSAVYRPSSDTILGTMQNYVVEFDAASGSPIRAVKSISPMFGPMWINLIDGIPYIACRFPPADAGDSGTDIMWGSPLKDIFPLHPDTLEKNGTGLIFQSGGFFMGGSVESQMGPTQFFASGNQLIFLYPGRFATGINVLAIDTVTEIQFNEGLGSYYWSEQACTDGTWIYGAEPASNAIRRFTMDLNDYSWGNTFPEPYDDLTAHFPMACELVAGTVNKVHAVEATKWLLRVDEFEEESNDYTSSYTEWDMEVLLTGSGITGMKPMRLRFNPVDGLLYIPCQDKDGIVVFDPVAETAVWKSGFDCPVDVVFTATKKFAVQTGLTGLKEIT